MAQAKRGGVNCAMVTGAEGMGAIRQQESGADWGGGGQDFPQQALGLDGWASNGNAVKVTASVAASIAPTSLLSPIVFECSTKMAKAQCRSC